MKLRTIIASLVLGSSSIAMASPAVTFSATARGAYGTAVVRDHRIDPRLTYDRHRVDYRFAGWHREPLPPVFRSLVVADAVRLGSWGVKDLFVDPQRGAFDTLTLDAQGGRVYIKTIVVNFTDGAPQIIELDRELAGNQSVTLDLAARGRAVTRVEVGGGERGSSWQPGGALRVTLS